MYKADAVPVGEDQVPHVELTREIARRFNHLFEEVFPNRNQKLTRKVLAGPRRKMSKWLQQYHRMSDIPETVRKKVMTMVTDPARIRKDDPGHPEVCTVFAFHKVFNEEGVDEIGSLCRSGSIGCVQCKKILASKMAETLTPIYEKRQGLLERPAYIREVIESGNDCKKIAKDHVGCKKGKENRL